MLNFSSIFNYIEKDRKSRIKKTIFTLLVTDLLYIFLCTLVLILC